MPRLQILTLISARSAILVLAMGCGSAATSTDAGVVVDGAVSFDGATDGGNLTSDKCAAAGPCCEVFISTGNSGHRLWSGPIDGLQERSIPAETWPYDVAYGNGRFVVVGTTITPMSAAILVSDDGINWTSVASPKEQWLSRVEYVLGAFYALGRGGTLLRSIDGTTWEDLSLATPFRLSGIVASGSEVVITTDAAGSVALAYMVGDGSVYAGPIDNLSVYNVGVDDEGQSDVAYGNGIFVAAGGRGKLYRSVDGKTWSIAVAPTDFLFRTLVFGAGRFFAFNAIRDVFASDDGVEWTKVYTIEDRSQWGAATFDGFQLVFTGTGLDDTVIITSPDGNTWTETSWLAERVAHFGMAAGPIDCSAP